MYTGTYPIKEIFGKDQRLVVPLFQRKYVWSREHQWEPLWDDIRNVAERHLRNETPRPHFLGAAVLDQIKQPIGRVDSRLVIDGQQRLTTIQLFIEAFADICSELGQEKYHKALVKLTRNDNPLSEDENEIYKIWPTNSDQEHFRIVMQAGNPDEVRKYYRAKIGVASVGNAIADCYLYFHLEIAGWLSAAEKNVSDRVEILYKTICEYLRMVVIELDKDDDAQLIFETLNARGTPLLASDLVKNFLFHKAEIDGEKIDQLYNKYWRHFDDDYRYWQREVGVGHAKRARIDLFLQHFLTLRINDEVPSAHIYTTYRQTVTGNKSSKASDHLKDLHNFAEIYQKISNLSRSTRSGISLNWLDILGVTTVYPFMLGLFSRYDSDDLEIEKTLIYIESYLVRRMVCQLTTRGYNRTFLDLLSVFSESTTSVSKKVFETLSGFEAESNRWPRDAEFKISWMERPIYNLLRQQRLNLILESLERALHTDFTEDIDIKRQLTIEHIMPQEWRKNWPLPTNGSPDELEVTRNRLLHSFGNLTLLTNKLNPSVSNSAWENKKGGIKKHSILLLNKELDNLPVWDEETIETRGKQMFKLAQKIWPAPKEKSKALLDKSQEILLAETGEQQNSNENVPTRDTNKYDIAAYGMTLTNQAIQNAMYHVVKNLCSRGATPEQIATLIYWKTKTIFWGLDGNLTSEEFIQKASNTKGRSFDKHSWFCDDAELFYMNGKTFAFTKMWGNLWAKALGILGKEFPDANIEFSVNQVE
jgi:hypothetical protein